MTEAAVRELLIDVLHSGTGRAGQDEVMADQFLAALDAANLTIVERGMVAIRLSVARAIQENLARRGGDVFYERRLAELEQAIARAESGPGEGEGTD